MGTHSVLQAYADSWVAGDIDALFAAYAENAVFHYFGSSDLAGTHVGRERLAGAKGS